MKRYAVADEVPEDCDYLTAGKEYEFKERLWGQVHIDSIIADDGGVCPINPEQSTPLNGKSWRIVEREE